MTEKPSEGRACHRGTARVSRLSAAYVALEQATATAFSECSSERAGSERSRGPLYFSIRLRADYTSLSCSSSAPHQRELRGGPGPLPSPRCLRPLRLGNAGEGFGAGGGFRLDWRRRRQTERVAYRGGRPGNGSLTRKLSALFVSSGRTESDASPLLAIRLLMCSAYTFMHSELHILSIYNV